MPDVSPNPSPWAPGLWTNMAPSVSFRPGSIPQTAPAATPTPVIDSSSFELPQVDTSTTVDWQNDPYLKALYSTLGGHANTTGYDAAIRQNAIQRKQLQQRYNTYSAQISDVFGNLSRKILPEALTGITQASEATRAQEAAQQAKYAEATRTADQARLAAANAARANLGLSDTAAAAAGGDIATQTTEAGLADKAGLDAATLQTILTNEAIAKGDINRQIAGLGYGQQEALNKLGTTRENALASLAAQDAQIQAQKSQAISNAQPSTAEQMAVLDAAEKYKASILGANYSNDPTSKWLADNPAQADAGKKLLAPFLSWFYNSAPAVEPTSGKAPTVDQYLQMFTKSDPKSAALLAKNPPLRDLLKTYLSTK